MATCRYIVGGTFLQRGDQPNQAQGEWLVTAQQPTRPLAKEGPEPYVAVLGSEPLFKQADRQTPVSCGQVTDGWILLGIVPDAPSEAGTGPPEEPPNSRWAICLYLLVLLLGVTERSVMRNAAYLHHPRGPVPAPGLWLRYYVSRLVCLAYFLYLALYPVSQYGLYGRVTIISFGYLMSFMVCTLLTLADTAAVKVRTAWYVVAIYSGAVMLATYLYQFQQVTRPPRPSHALPSTFVTFGGLPLRGRGCVICPASCSVVVAGHACGAGAG